MPQWEQLHRDIIADKENGKVILLEGSHYLHFEQKKAIVEVLILFALQKVREQW